MPFKNENFKHENKDIKSLNLIHIKLLIIRSALEFHERESISKALN